MVHYTVVTMTSVRGGLQVSSRASSAFSSLDLAKDYAEPLLELKDTVLIFKVETDNHSIVRTQLVWASDSYVRG